MFNELAESLSESLTIHGEQAVELGIDHVGEMLESVDVTLEFHLVSVDDDEVPLVGLNPFLVAVVETLEVVDANASFKVAAALLYLFH